MRTLLTFFVISSSILLAQSVGQPNASQIAERSIAVADRNWTARQNYTYVERDEEKRFDSEGRTRSTDVRVARAIFLNGNIIDQTVSHNGGPPTPEQKTKDQELLRKRRSETPQERAARLREEKENRAFIGEVDKRLQFPPFGRAGGGGETGLYSSGDA
jgi:hypothetical protein